MKKPVIIILLAVLSLYLSGCVGQSGKAASYRVCFLSSSDSESIDCESEFDFCSQNAGITPAEVQTVTIGGQEVKGRFSEEFRYSQNPEPCYLYRTDNGSEFGLSADGTPVYWFDSSVSASRSGEDIGTEACREIAERFAAGFFDTKSYTVDVKKNNIGLYDVVFIRYIDGMKTTDNATVSVRPDGTVVSLSGFSLKTVPSDMKNVFDKEAVKRAVLERTKAFGAILENKYDEVSYEVDDDFYLTCTADGACACFVRAKAICKTISGESYLGRNILCEYLVLPDSAK